MKRLLGATEKDIELDDATLAECGLSKREMAEFRGKLEKMNRA
jgi:hypothetical protein